MQPTNTKTNLPDPAEKLSQLLREYEQVFSQLNAAFNEIRKNIQAEIDQRKLSNLESSFKTSATKKN